MAACYRMCTAGHWKTGWATGHTRLKERMHRQVPLTRLRSDRIAPIFEFDNEYSVELLSRGDWMEDLPDLGDLTCYTDGSRLEETGLSGAGVYIHYLSVEWPISLGKLTTVTQAELWAILSCVELEQVRLFQGGSIVICSDSQCALQSLASPKITSSLVKECRDSLRQLAATKTVKLVWVPGHSGVEGNERADSLARRGSSTQFYGPEPVIGVSSQVIKTAFSRWSTGAHSAHWRMVVGCRQAKELIASPSAKFTRSLLRLDRKWLRLLVGVLTGHCGLNKHLTTLRVANDSRCGLCRTEDETALHYLGQCDALAFKRLCTFGSAYLTPKDIQAIKVSTLLEFIKNSKRFDT